MNKTKLLDFLGVALTAASPAAASAGNIWIAAICAGLSAAIHVLNSTTK